MAEQMGLEPTLSPVTGEDFNQLNYCSINRVPFYFHQKKVFKLLNGTLNWFWMRDLNPRRLITSQLHGHFANPELFIAYYIL